jgi:hypothetical protein
VRLPATSWCSVGRAFSFELARLLHDGVTELLGTMESKRLIERSPRGAYFSTRAGCAAVRTTVTSAPSAARWGHLVPKAKWRWIDNYDELAERARRESSAQPFSEAMSLSGRERRRRATFR